MSVWKDGLPTFQRTPASDWREGHADSCGVWMADKYDCSCGETNRRGAIVRALARTTRLVPKGER